MCPGSETPDSLALGGPEVTAARDQLLRAAYRDRPTRANRKSRPFNIWRVRKTLQHAARSRLACVGPSDRVTQSAPDQP
jgi:hypothetical protein